VELCRGIAPLIHVDTNRGGEWLAVSFCTCLYSRLTGPTAGLLQAALVMCCDGMAQCLPFVTVWHSVTVCDGMAQCLPFVTAWHSVRLSPVFREFASQIAGVHRLTSPLVLPSVCSSSRPAARIIVNCVRDFHCSMSMRVRFGSTRQATPYEHLHADTRFCVRLHYI
jgi:hypothetical protein